MSSTHKNLPQLRLLLLTLIAGIMLGFSLSQLLNNSNCALNLNSPTIHAGSWMINEQQRDHDEEELFGERSAFAPNVNNLAAEETALLAQDQPSPYTDDSSTLAQQLHNSTRVLCWILTGPHNHAKRAQHVKNTWGSRCNKLIFMSSQADEKLGAVRLSVGEGRDNLWLKTREAAKYIYDNHFDEADWFLKADDDTYVIVENLRAFLYQFSSDVPVYFGCKFKPHVRQGYMSGGAGYVLSKEALRRFVEQAYPNSKLCRARKGGSEDKEMGNCLQNVGVVAGDSRDEQKRGRFFPSGPQGHLIPKDKKHWYWRYIFYATNDGLDCCSDFAISFHYIQPNEFYVLDYLIYQLKTFGIHDPASEVQEMPSKRNMTALLAKWRNETSDNPL